jgi:hypothetical protein
MVLAREIPSSLRRVARAAAWVGLWKVRVIYNGTKRGRRWQVLVKPVVWRTSTGTWPRPTPGAVNHPVFFRYWRIGPFDLRRFRRVAKAAEAASAESLAAVVPAGKMTHGRSCD